jgi:hypothetical protein
MTADVLDLFIGDVLQVDTAQSPLSLAECLIGLNPSQLETRIAKLVMAPNSSEPSPTVRMRLGRHFDDLLKRGLDKFHLRPTPE